MLRIILWLIIIFCLLMFFTRKKRIYKTRFRCKECGKIYDCCTCEVPNYCKKCGAKLFTERKRPDLFGFGECSNTESNNLQTIVAKRTLKGWEIKRVSHE